MTPKTFMFIAGEASGDLLAADLVKVLRAELPKAEASLTDDVQPLHTCLEPQFFGAGGPRMAEAGVKLAGDMTQHAVIGLSDALKKYGQFRRIFHQLLHLARERQPDVIVCVDFYGFNGRFAHAITQHVRQHHDWFHAWKPKIVQYVSPQVWASRPGRVYRLARDVDLLLSVVPFDKEWYATRVPQLRVEFVGHPILDRFKVQGSTFGVRDSPPSVVLLPGSRPDELRRHVPVMLGVAQKIQDSKPDARFTMVLPSEELKRSVGQLGAIPPGVEVRVGGLADALAQAALAITKSGTITLECALFGVPAVVFYRTSWPTYFVGRQVVTAKYIAMPNLLANEAIYPEFIQKDATLEKIAREALDLLTNPPRRNEIKAKLEKVVESLGKPGASHRAGRAIIKLLFGEAAVPE